MTPKYLGSSQQYEALLADAVAVADQDVRGIATRDDSWAKMQDFVAIHPGPPEPGAVRTTVGAD
jgi:hypothetical protein